MTQTISPAPALDAESLKARYKLVRDQGDGPKNDNWAIRLHRSLSWAQRAEQLPPEHPEARLLYWWIALNCLYSRWNAERNAPGQDAAARKAFLDCICRMDEAMIGQALRKTRPLINRILDNPFLSDVFWRNPDDPASKGRATADANHLEKNLKRRQWFVLLDQVMQRIVVLRGQIVHGAASFGSRLNRTSVRDALRWLEMIVPVIQLIMIDHGRHKPWPELCYPPQAP